ncbi:MAG: hypothetical protein IT440_11105 [Phycisphaeraceae bacterium]|nr:hypothetical protein [Phycisphaeraceae bacterium]
MSSVMDAGTDDAAGAAALVQPLTQQVPGVQSIFTRDYMPLDGGNVWNYSGLANGQATNAVQTVLSNPVTLHNVATMPMMLAARNATDTSYFSVDDTGLLLHRRDTFDPTGSGVTTLLTYDQPVLMIPANFSVGDVHTFTATYTGTRNGAACAGSITSGTTTFLGFETVGSFTAAKIQIVTQWTQQGAGAGSGTTTQTFWLAEGVGPVKMTMVRTSAGSTLNTSFTMTTKSLAAKPDLKPTTVAYAPGTVFVGGTMAVAATLANQGSAALTANASFITQARLSLDLIWGNDDDILLAGDSTSTGPIGVSGTTATLGTLNIPANAAAGSYYLAVRTDATDAVNEVLDGNNTWWSSAADVQVELPAGVGDTVWSDANSDGLLNNGETGVAGVTVHLLSSATQQVLATTTTNASGTYQFTGLFAGSYIIQVDLPPGRDFTTANAGANDGIDSDILIDTGRSAAFALAAGQNETSLDAGLVELPLELRLQSNVDSFTLIPGQAVIVDVFVDSTPSVLSGFRLNFTSSTLGAGGLTLSNWIADAAFASTDGNISDGIVSAGVAGSHVDATLRDGSPIHLGSFTLTMPSVTGSFTLTLQNAAGAATQILTAGAQAVAIDDFGHVAVQVALDATGPAVESLLVNADQIDPANVAGKGAQPTDWTTQRSVVQSIAIVFDEAVVVHASDLVLTWLGFIDIDQDADRTITITDDMLSYAGRTLTIDLSDVAILDGRYTIRVQNTVENLSGLAGQTWIGSFHQLAGDFSGDGSFNLADFGTLAYWLGQSGDVPGYLDVTGDGAVNGSDLRPLVARLGTTLDNSPVVIAALSNDAGDSATDGLTFDPTIAGTILGYTLLSRLDFRIPELGGTAYDITSHVNAQGAFTLSRSQMQALLGQALTDTTYSLQFRAADVTGVVTDWITVAVTLDTVAPTGTFDLAVASDTGTVGDQTTKLATVTLTGTINSGSTVQLVSQGLTANVVNGVFTMTGVSLDLGNNGIDLLVTDTAGNHTTIHEDFCKLDNSPIVFNVTYDDPGNAYADYHDLLTYDLQAAGWLWTQHLAGSGNLEVVFHLGATDPVLERAWSGSLDVVYVATINGMYIYMQGAAAEISGRGDPNGSAADLEIFITDDYLENDLWLDPNPYQRVNTVPANRTDAVSVLAHELGHCLAFNGWLNSSTMSFTVNYRSTFDLKLTTGNGLAYFTGANAVAVYGGNVPITTGNPNHIGNEGQAAVTDLMNGKAFFRGQRYNVSALDLAILKDIGLTLVSTPSIPASQSPPSVPLAAIPSSTDAPLSTQTALNDLAELWQKRKAKWWPVDLLDSDEPQA